MCTTIFPEPSTKALINLTAFRQNIAAVRSYVGSEVRILAVVKADAYGHGAVRMAREALAGGAEYLGVARVHEGVELRTAGFRAPILVFEAPPASHLSVAIEQELDLTIVSANDAASIDQAARELGGTAKVHFKVDTGMGRLGLPHERAAEEILGVHRLAGLSPTGIYSHFATSEDPDQTYAQLQLDRFRRVLDALAGKDVTIPIRHMANSGAIMTLPQSHLDMVRPGIMLYGYPPRHMMSETHPVKPVMSLVSRLAMVKAVPAGSSISYGRRYTTHSRTIIGTIPVGYADGYPRSLTNNATVLIQGRRFPLVGTVCMDHIMVDLGDSSFKEGTPVILFGNDGRETITAWDIAAAAGTIPYEITCLVTRRVPREYVG